MICIIHHIIVIIMAYLVNGQIWRLLGGVPGKSRSPRSKQTYQGQVGSFKVKGVKVWFARYINLEDETLGNRAFYTHNMT